MRVLILAAFAILLGCQSKQASPTTPEAPSPQAVSPPQSPATAAPGQPVAAGQPVLQPPPAQPSPAQPVAGQPVSQPPPAQPVAGQPVSQPTPAQPTPAPGGHATPPVAPTSPPADGLQAPSAASQADLARRMKAALAKMGPAYKPRTHHLNPDGSPVYLNRLIFESSPYLLQHAHNPVNWRPWGDEAFAEARRTGKPVLMSVGYATCHWCHVMERESFEDVEIAKYMNDNYVCIKVDREERPDVDNIYMDAVHMLHGRGGWPMTIAMTPDREPFFGGTYFPPRDGVRGSRKGFLTILGELKTQYDTDRPGVVAKAKQLSQRIAQQAAAQPSAGVPNHAPLASTAGRFKQMHDAVNGGFGRQPKFPRPVTLDFLLRYHRRTGDKPVLDAVLKTLDKMNGGGMHDQIGGGFHRYSVDSRWLVPHFEKMLYDNAQLTRTYLDAYQITDNAEYARVARMTLDYVIREMVDPTGAFWSATDADSEGHEGLFFIWTKAQLEEHLGPALAPTAIQYWGVTDHGNFEHKNILNVPVAHDLIATRLGITPVELRTRIDKASKILYDIRKKRIPPLTDDKILTAWNGLMISAFARGAFVLADARYVQTATVAAEAVLKNLRGPDGRLLRTYRNGMRAQYMAYLEDYAFLAAGMLDLFEATGEPRWLQTAVELHGTLAQYYEDKALGGFFRTASDAEKLLTRDKPDYDGAEPSGNSVATDNLVRLWQYTGDEKWKTQAERVLKWSASRIQRSGPAIPAMLGALDHYLDKTRQVVIVEAPGDVSTEKLVGVLRSHYLPNRMVVRAAAEKIQGLAQKIPMVDQKVARGGKTTAYVCEGGLCKRPTSDPAVFKQQLVDVRPYAVPAALPPQ